MDSSRGSSASKVAQMFVVGGVFPSFFDFFSFFARFFLCA